MTRPIRAAVLAAGFGFGIAVMVALLGVGQVILEQAHAPALQGGGDLVVSGPFGQVPNARFVLSTVQRTPEIADRISAISVTRRARLYLITPKKTIQITATGGVPSLEKSIGDREVSTVGAWTDAPGDQRWVRPETGDVLRAMDRFHPIPESHTSSSSWAEWLYFNGRTRDGRVRLYLTFFVGPPADAPGMRQAGVRLQLDRDGRSTSYSSGGLVDEASMLAHAPDLEIGGSRVRLEGSTYRIGLALPGLEGAITLDAAAHRSMPPATIRGAGGWVSGYVVPVLSGTMRGDLRVGGDRLAFDDAAGYHDHNWGFWEGVRWQWGQVAHDDLSIVYGRVFPPAEVADQSRIPGFLAVLGADGLLGFSTNVAIDDTTEGRVDVHATRGLDLRLTLSSDETVRNAMTLTRVAGAAPLNFLQLSGVFQVKGTVAGRDIEFAARGSAETFRPPTSAPR
ncbi:MAG: hypothetical protein ABJA98_10645 [Acidobacteriota bacterium]